MTAPLRYLPHTVDVFNCIAYFSPQVLLVKLHLNREESHS